MSNNINWGKIYESTAWGSGVTDNNISWGKSYADLAGGGGTPFVGLLDTYSGAAAAYALRQLSSTYSGDAIVVRRASDNTTQAIGFVNNELDTATLESFCSGTDGFVTTWYDQSGNGNDAAQASASSQPQIVSSGSTILVNTKPTLEFNGASYYLQASTINVPQPTSYFITYKYSAVSDTLSDLSDGIDSRQLNDTASSGFARIFSGSSLLSNSLTSVNQALRFSLFNSVNSALAINGGTLSTGNAGATAIQNMNIGKSNTLHLNGNIQEFIIYPTNETSNRSGIETNINDHYSIY